MNVYGLPTPEEFAGFRDLTWEEFKRTYGGLSWAEHGPDQRPAELKVMIDLVRALAPKTMLEIGQYYGGTLWHWMRAAPDARIVGVDMDHSRLQPYIDRSKVTLVAGDSSSAPVFDRVRHAVGELDFLFIDGCHLMPVVRSDYDMYGPLVRRGGVIVFHDIHCGIITEGGLNHVRIVWDLVARGSDSYFEYFADSAKLSYGIGVIVKT